jgi:hypothetical protein
MIRDQLIAPTEEGSAAQTEPWTHPPLLLLGTWDRFTRAVPTVIKTPPLLTPRENNGPAVVVSHERREFSHVDGGRIETAAAAAAAAEEQGITHGVASPSTATTVHVFHLGEDAKAWNAALSLEAHKLNSSCGGDRGVRMSNRNGGYHSARPLQSLPSDEFPCFEEFHAMLSTAISVASLTTNKDDDDGVAKRPVDIKHSWVNINGPQSFNALHDHKPSAWSGVYYVQLPLSMEKQTDPPLESDGSGGNSSPLKGSLLLRTAVTGALGTETDDDGHDQGTAASLPEASSACHYTTVAPQAGMLVVFPGALKHAVAPFQGDPGEERISISFNLETS